MDIARQLVEEFHRRNEGLRGPVEFTGGPTATMLSGWVTEARANCSRPRFPTLLPPNTIRVLLSRGELKKRSAGVVTDSKALDDPLDPEAYHVFALLKMFVHGKELAGWYRAGSRDCEAFGCWHAKQLLAAKTRTLLTLAGSTRRSRPPSRVERCWRRAEAVGVATMDRVRRATGLR